MERRYKYKKFLIFFESILLLTIETTIFGYIWYTHYIDYIQLSFYRRGNYAVIGSYTLILLLITKLYGGFKIGYLRIQNMPVELIIVDNASVDHTSDVIQGCQAEWKSAPINWKVIHCGKNLGATAGRNLGVANASAPYVAFLDSDDWWATEKLKKQIALLKKTGGVLCSTGREFTTYEGELTGHTIPVKSIITYQDLLHDNIINCSSVLILTSVAKEFPMEHDEYHEDYITWLRVLKKYKTAYAINEPLLKYRRSADGKSANKWKSARMHYYSLRLVGIGAVKAMWYSCFYAISGVKKYGIL